MIKPIVCLLVLAVCSQIHATDITKLVQETQKIAQTPGNMSLVWWIPLEFWEESLDQDPRMTEEQKADFIEILEEYTVFAVVESEIGTFGSFKHKPKSEIRDNVKFEIDGDEIEQIPYIAVNQDASNFFITMKPLMGQMMGEMGKGMEFIVFPNEIGGERLLDPRSEGAFTFTSFGNEFKWRLPLGSLMPPMIDQSTGEEFPGNYSFNPYNGNELVRKE
ncbi:hypothetical protein [Pelagicoccus sp. SDUM812003]|uniref:hypothetical protein n=1 Tax=Pelagicoccus sp. SDUM812003 TaxID=3041267 RepID=UPI00280E03BE|nr:hypothetical protein [Pelagicoccus sp. SDUM812003]MDQ8204524.1 hypothetical protein [Pelagicoccus sp. SDUM812003]